MPIPKNRIDQQKVQNWFITGVSNGIHTIYDNLTKTISFSIAYSTKNLKIGIDDKLNTVQDIDSTASPEFIGLKVGTDTGIVGRSTGTLNNISVASPLTLVNNVLSSQNTNIIKVITPIELHKDDAVYNLSYPKFIGISKDNYALGTEATIVTSGEVTVTQTLVPEAKYFIDNTDKTKITTVVPTDEYLVYVGIAISQHVLKIENNLVVDRR